MDEEYKKPPFPTAYAVHLEQFIGLTRASAFPPENQKALVAEISENYDYLLEDFEGLFQLENQSLENTVDTALAGYSGIGDSSELLDRNIIKVLVFIYKKRRNIGKHLSVHASFHFTKQLPRLFSALSFQIFLRHFSICENLNLINSPFDSLRAKAIVLSRNAKSGLEAGREENIPHSEKNDLEKKFVEIVETPDICTKHFSKDFFLNPVCSNCRNNHHSVSAEFFFLDEKFKFLCSSCSEKKNGVENNKLYKITPRLLRHIWSKEEEYYLLKGLSIYTDSWDNVASYINNELKLPPAIEKTRSACIYHFLVMPILETLDKYTTVPFSCFENQISTCIAFINAYIDQKLASCVSRRVLEIVSDEIKMKSETEIIESKKVQESILHRALELVGEDAVDMACLEREKLQRLGNVRTEAYLYLVKLKLETVEQMDEERKQIKEVLIDESERIKVLLSDHFNH